MTKPQYGERRTLLDAILASLEFARRSPDGVAPPAAMLWTDAGGQWRSLLPALRGVLPYLYNLGAYDPKNHAGPAIWLKCVVERVLPDVAPPAGVVPVLYLPRASRQNLRSGGDCPPAVQPLIEPQYRGALWHQKYGRDWTVEAFLSSEDGVGLDISLDNRTREAMVRALKVLATEPLASLTGAASMRRISTGSRRATRCATCPDGCPNRGRSAGVAIRRAGMLFGISAKGISRSTRTGTAPAAQAICF